MEDTTFLSSYNVCSIQDGLLNTLATLGEHSVKYGPSISSHPLFAETVVLSTERNKMEMRIKPTEIEKAYPVKDDHNPMEKCR